jgi:hypothetical protein
MVLSVGLLMSAMPSGSCAEDRSSFYDRNGHFFGSSVKTGKETTSFYDHNGHFLGTKRDDKGK